MPAGKAKAYSGAEPATTKPVDELTQGQYYGRALQLAFCQPNVTGIFFFHSQDEPALASWQSGLYYADGTPKSSLYAVRDALAPGARRLDRPLRGARARCDGDEGALPDAGGAEPGRPRRAGSPACWTARGSCGPRARRQATRGARLTGYGRAGLAVTASLKGRKLGTGTIRFSITLTQPVNPGVPQTRESTTLSVG